MPLTKTISNASKEAGSASGVEGHAELRTKLELGLRRSLGLGPSDNTGPDGLNQGPARNWPAGIKPGLADPLPSRILVLAPNWAFPRLYEPVAVTSEGTWDGRCRREA